jgi:hypothetical protein
MVVKAHEPTRQEKIRALAEIIADLFIDFVPDDEYAAKYGAFIGAELPQAEPTENNVKECV